MQHYTIRDVPDDGIDILCTMCKFRKSFEMAGLLQKYSPDLYLDIFVRAITEFCEHRQAYSVLPPCGAYTPQMETARKAVTDRNAEKKDRRRQASVERAEAALLQEERAENAVIRIADGNGWRLYEAIPLGTAPKYRWQQSWEEACPEDIIGFDGTVPIGRVFQFEPHITNRDVWFWVLYGVEDRKRTRPGQGAGWEQSRLLAVCRVEWCYDTMIEKEAQAEKWRRGKNVQSV
ncbi:hypothetical protein F4V91_08010 [Neorhizobium galegae]|uniref:Uncharacterized protein n=1 Tax=Neorhizobium galegae TaxID=399 RepID=A0A6A1TPH1_NEOGA|nr:hypothetical protein [Neorhizobium galegae]KAB1086379.1 hypothetical protein F4V91_08010 [Neorhizobium galegae]